MRYLVTHDAYHDDKVALGYTFQGKEFEYQANTLYAVGDLVLCDTRRGMLVGQVTKVSETTICFEGVTKQIFGKFELSGEINEAYRTAKKAALMRKLKKAVEEHSFHDFIKQVAAKDEKVAELLAEYEAL